MKSGIPGGQTNLISQDKKHTAKEGKQKLYAFVYFWVLDFMLEKCCVFSGEVANTNLNFFGLTWPGIKPTTYCTCGKNSNQYTTKAV